MTPTIPLLTKGDVLEYRCYRLLQKMGYLVRRQQVILTIGGISQVTDIDLYGIKFNLEFSKDVVIVECKNRKKSSPLDRILWLRGLKEIVGAHSALLFIPGAKWDIKDYAFDKGVKVIDSEFLDYLESALDINQSVFYGLTDFRYYELLYAEWKPLLFRRNKYRRVLDFLHIEAKTTAPYKGINRLFSEIKWVLPSLSTREDKASRLSLWLLYEIVICMCTFLLSLCEYLQILSPADRRGYLEKYLAYGDWNPQAADDLLKTSWRVASRLSKEQFGKALQIPGEFHRFPKPDYYKGVLEVVERFCGNSKFSGNTIKILDLILFEFVFKGKPIDNVFINSFFGLGPDYDMSIKQMKNIVELIVKYGSVPDSYFKPILDL